jgi:3D (Asp-Asp-Asp) domain-containing protein
MAGWKELLIDVLKLTDETKRLNQDIDKLQSHVVDVDKRVVRLETLVEVAKYNTAQDKIAGA